MIAEIVRELVREECRRSANVFGAAFFDEHLAVVADYGRQLAEKLGADLEIVQLAAYLHDISAVRDAATLPEHARLSAGIARRVLAEHGYAAARAERVAQAIASHTSPIRIGGGCAEEVCVSNADAIAQIVRPAFWFYFVYGVRRQAFEEGRQWLRQRVESNWNALIGPAKDLAREGYDLMQRLP